MFVRRTTRLDEPPLRNWDLNETHTRYDYPRAHPSDGTLHIQFTVMAVINAVVALACLFLICTILRSPRVRQNPFNFYLLYLAIPDFLTSLLCLITCALSATTSSYFSEAMCGFQSFYLVFGFTANCWMNGVIAFQIHRLLRYSNRRRRFTPPTRKRVSQHAAMVYSYAAALATLGVWPIPGLPHRTYAYYGFACFPMEYNLESALFLWLFFVPAFLLLPAVYTIFALFDIWRRNLLPLTGRRRMLSIYFFRLIMVYLIMWIPFVIVSSMGNFVILDSWVFLAGAAWGHLQGIASVLLSFTKADIHEAGVSLICCQQPESPDGPSSDISAARRMSFMQSFKSFMSSKDRFPPASSQMTTTEAQTSIGEEVSTMDQAAASHPSVTSECLHQEKEEEQVVVVVEEEECQTQLESPA